MLAGTPRIVGGSGGGGSGGLVVGTTTVTGATNGFVLYNNAGVLGAETVSGTGTVTSVSVVTANGVSGSVATATTTPAITLTLNAITPSSVAATGLISATVNSTTSVGYSFAADSTTGLGYVTGNLLLYQSGKLSLVLSDSLLSFRIPSNYAYSWAGNIANNVGADTGMSRLSAGSVAVGNGTSGDTSGSLTAASFVGALTGNASTATKLATVRTIAGTSFDGSANVSLANKFIVQGTSDAGLSAAQFLGALATGIVKSTTSTGVLSIAVAGDFPTLNQSTTGSAATLTTPRAINGVNFDGSAAITVAAAAGTLTGTTLNSTVVTSSITTLGSSASLPGSPTTTTQSQSDNSTKVATTAYADLAVANAIAGVNPAVAVSAATTQASDTSSLTYSNGAGGIGATLTGTANTAVAVDGFTFTAVGQRLLVKNDTQSPSGAFNGVYSMTVLQTVGIAPVFTRALDYDQPSDMNSTGAIPVVSGTANASTSWLLTSTVVTVGTTPLTYVQFSLAPSSVVTLTGTQTLTNKRVTRRVVTTTQSATPTINTDNTDVAYITGLAQAVTSFTTNLLGTPANGDMFIIDVTDNGTGRALAFGSGFEASTVALPATTVASTKLTIGFRWNVATSKWTCVAVA